MTQREAYEAACKIARDHGLVYQAYGGVVLIVDPDTQREQGIYDHIQYVNGLGPHPDSVVHKTGPEEQLTMFEGQS